MIFAERWLPAVAASDACSYQGTDAKCVSRDDDDLLRRPEYKSDSDRIVACLGNIQVIMPQIRLLQPLPFLAQVIILREHAPVAQLDRATDF